MKRIEIMGCPMDVATINETVDIIDQAISNNQFTQHVVVNVAKFVRMQTDQYLNSSVRACDIINIDGMGIVYGAKFLNFKVSKEHKVSGVDLFFQLIKLSAQKNYKVYLLGGTEDVIKLTHDTLLLKYPNLNIVGYHHGYFGDQEKQIVEKIKSSGAQLLFVAITSPKKENFINKWKKELNVNFVMGVGGTFDIVSGKIKRAPIWMQKNGLEWIFRIIQEPKRMWKRYAYTNYKFFIMLIKNKFIKNE